MGEIEGGWGGEGSGRGGKRGKKLVVAIGIDIRIILYRLYVKTQCFMVYVA